MNMPYEQRRQRFMAELGNAVAIIPANREITRSADTHYPFRQSNNFQYLTGFPEPEAVAVFTPSNAEQQFTLFVRPRDKMREIWDGRRYGPEGAKEHFGADATYPIDQLDAEMPRLLKNVDELYYAFLEDAQMDHRLKGWLRSVASAGRRTGDYVPTTFRDPGVVLSPMRLIKDEGCLAAMRKAAKLSVEAHRLGMKATEPGLNEAQLQAVMEHHCRMGGSPAQAYTSIVAGGDNANILHYVENNQELRDGELVLVDFGCEYDHYASDITRTWPVNGTFTAEQRLIYDIVLKSQEAAIEACKPGDSVQDKHIAASRSLAESLVELGILKGDPEVHAAVATGEDTETKFPEDEPVLRDFYMHGTGHWIGMDVHDCGEYRRGGEWTELKPGMCVTVEPGLYFSKDNEKAPEAFRGIGVRIEDDILVTENGYENLTEGLPRTADEVEACCATG